MTPNPPTPKLTDLSQQRLELAARLLRQKNGNPAKAPAAPSIPRQPRTPELPTFPLSFTQQRLWILDQLDPGLAAYYIPVAVRFMGRLDIGVLTRCLNEIGQRHEGLRTTFNGEGERPVQVIQPAVFQPLPLIDLTDLEAAARETELARLIKAELHQPFDLTHGPLLRLNLFRLGEADHLLLLTIHHIVCDGWSLGVIVREITALYQAFSLGQPLPLPELPIQYADYAAWQREWFQGEVLETQLAYWKKQLAGAATVLELPSDRPRPAVQSFRGAGQMLIVPSGVTEALKALSQRAGATLFMTLLAAFQTLLHRYSGQADIIVGTPIANRTRVETEGLIGYFANMLALRADLREVEAFGLQGAGDPSFLDLLRRVRETALGAYAHQDLPFEQLVEALELERDLSRNPLFQVLFGLHNAPIPKFELPGLTISRPTLKAETSRFDLGLDMWESAQGLIGALEYKTDLFDDSTMTRMIGHFQTLLAGIVADPEQRLSQLPLLTEAEQRQLLIEWNTTQAAYPSEDCVHQLFESQVDQTPDVIAVVFVAGKNERRTTKDERRITSHESRVTNHESLTYSELNRRANQLAQHLQTLGVGPEVRVGVCLERSLEMVVGLLGVLKAGGAYVPLDPAYPAERLAFMLEDSNAKVVVTQSHLLKGAGDWGLGAGVSTLCLDTDWSSIAQSAISNQQSAISPDHLAYILYTSGSTGRPKGVQISHRALVNFLCSVQRQPGLTPADVLLSVTTVAFDIFGLELYLPLISGARVEIASRETTMDGAQLRQHLLESGATVMQATPATWRLLLSEVEGLDTAEESEASDLDLSGLKILCGGEALPRPLADRLLATGGEVWNLYGPTETTIWSSVQRIEADQGPIVIGRPLANTQFYILDMHDQPVPIGVIGELHIGGEGLARGYLGRPELTAEKFVPNPFAGMQEKDQDQRAKGQDSVSLALGPWALSLESLRLYRTGDLARYLPNGTIELLSRRDHQVKVRGYRIELGEIEAVLKRHSAVREAVALVRDASRVPGDQRLVAYLVLKPGPVPTTAELRQSLKESLPEYMLPSAFIFLEQLPLTPNGKLDRKALIFSNVEELPAVATKDYVAPRNVIETTLAQIWAQLLRLERVSVQANFFELGGHSLLATQLISRVRQAFQVELPLRALFETPTVAGLAERIQAAKPFDFAAQSSSQASSPAPAIQRVAREAEGLPLSFAQERLWFLHQWAPDSSAYNIPAVMRLTGPLNVSAAEQSLNEIVRRHEALRTTFSMVDPAPSASGAGGQPLQVIVPALTLELPIVDLRDWPEPERELEARRWASKEVWRPFDLSRGPLLRAALVRLDETDHLLVLTLHHIISDGWSMEAILVGELATLYNAYTGGQSAELPELSLQYADFAQWQRQHLHGEWLEQQMAYWRQQLAGASTVLELPTDRPRPAMQTERGGTHVFRFAPDLLQALQVLSQQAGVSLFMTLLAAFQTLLYRYTGQPDILVGSPIANRRHIELERIIGFFVNTLVLRADLREVEAFGLQGAGNPTFLELLGRVREVCLGAYAHQDVPFEKLVDALQPERQLTRTPLFQVMLILQNTPRQTLHLPNLTLTPVDIDSGVSKFDLTLYLVETELGLSGRFEYNADLFDGTTIERLAEHLRILLEGIVAEPHQRLAALPLLSDTEQRQLLIEWNTTGVAYPEDHGLPHLFESQVERSPEAIAIVFQDQQLTYQALNDRADQLAQHLRGLGVGPEVRVGVCLERSVEMVVGLLGVLKAGGAYVPLDPAYPTERLAFMLEDSGAMVVVTQSQQLAAGGWPLATTNSHPSSMICLDTDWELIATSGQPLTADRQPPTPASLAYVLYTSGSTGRPKGVQISHRALVNFLCSVQRQPGLSHADVLLSVTTVAFDIFGLELYLPLITGARVEIASRETTMDGAQLRQQLLTSGATVMQATPATWRLLLDTIEESEASDLDLSGLKILCGGEALPRPLADRLLATGAEVWNLYGPTETTIWSSVQKIESAPSPIVIGRPLANTQFYILDQHSQPVPIGVIGELHIGGEGLARGYLGRPELTAEKFVPNPFAEMQEQAQGARHKAQETTNSLALGPWPLGLEPYALRLYKTGDLARYLPNGTLELLGRRDHQVKVRGYRIELGEIEAVLGRHPAVRACAVVAREAGHGEGKQLVAYVVPAEDEGRKTKDGLPSFVPDGLSTNELRAFLKTHLPDYMTPTAFVFLDALPLTPNGKVDRRALSEVEGPAPDGIRPELEATYVAPRNSTEATLARIWAELLNLEQVSIHDNFFTLGGDSLLVVRVIAQAGQVGLRFSTKLFFQHQTIAELAQALQTAPEIKAEQGLVVGPVPLTPIHHWYFDLEVLNPHLNNIALLFETPPGLDPAPLTPAVQQVLLHHDALRTRFERRAAGWHARIVEPGPATDSIIWIDLSTVPPTASSAVIQAACAQVQASLHLTRGPLLRLALFDLGPAQPGRVLLVFHHLVVDAFSVPLLLADLGTAYEQLRRGETVQLPPKTTSAKEWAERLVEYARSETLQSEVDYWLSLPWDQVVPLPVDVPAERANNRQGPVTTLTVQLSVEETDALLQQVRFADDLHVADFLLTALRFAFAPWTGDRPLLVDLVGHGHEPLFDDVDLSRTAQWSITLVPRFLEAMAEPLHALWSVCAARRRMPQSGIGFGVLRYLGEGVGRGLKTLPSAEVQFSYLGQQARLEKGRRPAQNRPTIRPAREPIEGLVDPRNKRPELFYCHSLIREGQLSLRFSYGDNLYRRETVEKLAGDFLEALRTLMRVHGSIINPGISVRPSRPPLAVDHPQRREIPLTLGALWFFRLNAPPPYQWNLPTLVEVDQRLNPDRLRQATQCVIRQHDSLNLRFAPEAGGWRAFVVEPDERTPFTYFDFSSLPPAEHRAYIEAAAAELQTRVNIFRGPLLQVAYLDLGPEQPGRLLILIHHLAADVFSQRIVFDDLQTAYQQLSHGRSVELPTKTTTFKQWSERLSAYARSAEALRQLDYWRSRPWDRLAHLPLDFPESPEANTLGSARKAQAALSAEETGRLLRQVPHAYGSQLMEILLAAMVQTLVRWTEVPALLVEVMNYGREASLAEIDLSQTVGWLAIGYPALFELNGSADLPKAVLAIREQLRTLPAEPIIGIGYQLLRDMRGDPALAKELGAWPQPEVVFNYLGQLNQGADRHAPIRPATESPGASGHPQRLRQRLLEFVIGIVGSRLILTIDYSENLHRRETVERLAENFIEALRGVLAESQMDLETPLEISVC